MELSKYTGAGNTFFERKLKDYRRLGLSYLDFWEKANDDFIRFQKGETDQGLQHCRDVENNIWKLINEYLDYFPPEVLYIVSMCSALHDCAKTGAGTDHAVKGAQKIREELVKMGYVQLQATANAISDIILVHSSGHFSSVPETFDVRGDVDVRLRDTAAIFRLADMMSTTEERAATAHKILGLRHMSCDEFLDGVRGVIQSCSPSSQDKTCIEIRAYADDIDGKRAVEAYVEGLNRDLTSDHRRILQNIKMTHIKKDTVRERDIVLPHRFKLSWLNSFRDTLPATIAERPVDTQKTPQSVKGISRLVQSYFVTTESDIDLDKGLLDSLERGVVDPKYLYWSLKGTKLYLSLTKNNNYGLPSAAHGLLAKKFATQIHPITTEDPRRRIQHLIDLGVGDGVESHIILSHLVSDNAEMSRICCSLIDFSYHMLKAAVNNIEEANTENERYRDNVELFGINGDIRNLYLYRAALKRTSGSRLFSLLGGTLGNYLERDLLEPIRKEMSGEDFLLLGVDLIGDRSDSELISAYDSSYNRKFLFNPLDSIGLKFGRCRFDCYIREKMSEVPKSKTIVSSFWVDEEIQMAISTKYDLESLRKHLVNHFGFSVLTVVINDAENYAILLMAT